MLGSGAQARGLDWNADELRKADKAFSQFLCAHGRSAPEVRPAPGNQDSFRGPPVLWVETGLCSRASVPVEQQVGQRA